VATTGKIEVGQRVWVADPAARSGRALGRIASLPDVFLSGRRSFVVLLEGKPSVVACCEDRRGSQWDFAQEDG
jgi:hypothetical protein